MRKLTVLAAVASAAITCLAAAPATAGDTDRTAHHFTVTARVNNAEPERGDKLKIRGEVTPARPGDVVKLQLRYGKSGAWKTADTDKLNARSRYKFVDKVSTVRFRQYRVVKPASGNRGIGRSPKVAVTVYGWRKLTSLDPAAAVGMYEQKSVRINAIDYPRSLIALYGNSGSIDYNLNRGCKTFDGTFGLDDSSASTATGTVELKADSVSKYSRAFTLTQSEAVSRDVRGVFRITVLWSSSNTAGTPENQSGAKVAVGTPRVLCSF